MTSYRDRAKNITTKPSSTSPLDGRTPAGPHSRPFSVRQETLHQTADVLARDQFLAETDREMALRAREEDRMARLRKRAEMQPSDDDESESESESGEQHARMRGGSEGGEGSEDDTGEGGDDDWGDEEDSGGATTERPSGEQEEPIGERLSKLSHGAGPSRRKRHLRDEGGEQRPAGAAATAARGSTPTGVHQKPGRGRGSGSERPKAPSRANKNRPQEASSLRAVGRFREVVPTKRKTARDPRFEGGGGSSKLNYDIFRKAYGFLGTYQDGEIEELKKSLKKEKNQERSARLQALLTRLQQERAERSQGDRTRAALREAKKKEREAVAGGKKPFFLKGSEKKRLSLEQRYEGLKEEGKLSKFMEKKRKKNAAKDHRWLPSKRQDRG